MRLGSLLILVCVAASISLASAQTPQSDAAKAVAGSWEFSNADRDKRCTVTFKTDAGAAGMKLEFDRACATVFPFIRDIAGWTIAENDFLRFVDSKGKAILEFSEVESGMFEAPRPGEGILFLQTVASVEPPPATPEQVAGDWAVIRGNGQPICTLTLTTTTAGQDTYALRLKPGCDAFVTRFAPTAWQMDRSELILKGARNQSWRFESSADARTWQRVPETRDPVSLVRQ
jgi:hypothetical protein